MRTKTEKRRRKAVLKIPLDWTNICICLIAVGVILAISYFFDVPLNEHTIGQRSLGFSLVCVCIGMLSNFIQCSFYEDALIFRLFGIPFRKIRWECVGTVGILKRGPLRYEHMKDCIVAGDIEIILVLGDKIEFHPHGGRNQPISFGSMRLKDQLRMVCHQLAIVSISLASGIDGAPYIDFVLKHTGKKLSFGDPNEGMEGDVQDTHPAEQPNNPDEK